MKDYTMERNRMVEEQLVSRDITDPGVLQAMRTVPRHRFVPSSWEDSAYSDSPLPIGQQQTISQPYIVALMTQALELKAGDRVLEIGTGSGYQAAVLAEIAREVYTIEKLETLLARARNVLDALGYDNIVSKLHNGTEGWPEHAPYNAIMVTAGAPEIPEPLLNQLKEGGRMVIPVGDKMLQELLKVTRKTGEIEVEKIGGCRFVSLCGKYGWPT